MKWNDEKKICKKKQSIKKKNIYCTNINKQNPYKMQDLKTEAEKQQEELTRKIVLQHCVNCHQQLDLLQLRLINFDDLVQGVLDSIKTASYQLKENKLKIKDNSHLKKV